MDVPYTLSISFFPPPQEPSCLLLSLHVMAIRKIHMQLDCVCPSGICSYMILSCSWMSCMHICLGRHRHCLRATCIGDRGSFIHCCCPICCCRICCCICCCHSWICCSAGGGRNAQQIVVGRASTHSTPMPRRRLLRRQVKWDLSWPPHTLGNPDSLYLQPHMNRMKECWGRMRVLHQRVQGA